MCADGCVVKPYRHNTKLIALAEWLSIPPDTLRYGAEIKTEILQAQKLG